jgi:hypothetical protein
VQRESNALYFKQLERTRSSACPSLDTAVNGILCAEREEKTAAALNVSIVRPLQASLSTATAKHAALSHVLNSKKRSLDAVNRNAKRVKTLTKDKNNKIKQLKRKCNTLQSSSNVNVSAKSFAILRAHHNISHTKAVNLCKAINSSIPSERKLYEEEKK